MSIELRFEKYCSASNSIKLDKYNCINWNNYAVIRLGKP